MPTSSTHNRRWSTAILVVFMTACGGSGGGTGSASGTGSGSGTGGSSSASSSTSTTGPSDGQPCVAECGVPADCCIGAGHPSGSALSDLACPGTRYPNNVDCVGGRCVNTCTPGASGCPLPDLECMYVAMADDYLCVEPCTTDDDCDDFSEASPALQNQCIGISAPPGGPTQTYCTFPR